MAKLSGRSCRIYDDVRDSKIHWDADINKKFDADLVRQHKERAFPRAAVGEPDNHERQHTRSKKSEYADKEKYVLSDFKPEMKLPTFDSSSLTLDFLDWIDTFQDYFEAMNLPDALKCKLTASKLKGEARVWWKELQNQRFLAGKDSITSWPIMRELLIKEFLHTSCLTYFHKQKNKGNMKHTNCLRKVPLQPINSSLEENNVCKIVDDLYHASEIIRTEASIEDDECSKEKSEFNERAKVNKHAKEEGAEVIEGLQIDKSMPTMCSMKFSYELNNNEQAKEISCKTTNETNHLGSNTVVQFGVNETHECEDFPPIITLEEESGLLDPTFEELTEQHVSEDNIDSTDVGKMPMDDDTKGLIRLQLNGVVPASVSTIQVSAREYVSLLCVLECPIMMDKLRLRNTRAGKCLTLEYLFPSLVFRYESMLDVTFHKSFDPGGNRRNEMGTNAGHEMRQEIVLADASSYHGNVFNPKHKGRQYRVSQTIPRVNEEFEFEVIHLKFNMDDTWDLMCIKNLFRAAKGKCNEDILCASKKVESDDWKTYCCIVTNRRINLNLLEFVSFYFDPLAWFVSILPDCKTTACNTAKVGERISIKRIGFKSSVGNDVVVPRSKIQKKSSNIPLSQKTVEHIGVLDHKKVTANGLLGKLKVSRDLSDYLLLNCERNHVEPSVYINGVVDMRAEQADSMLKVENAQACLKQQQLALNTTEGWTSHTTARIAVFACIVALPVFVELTDMRWSKEICDYITTLRQYGLNVNSSFKLQRFVKNSNGGISTFSYSWNKILEVAQEDMGHLIVIQENDSIVYQNFNLRDKWKEKLGIQIAWRLHRDVDNYLFDEPFWADQANIRKHLFNEYILDLLNVKVVAYMKHHMEFLLAATRTSVMMIEWSYFPAILPESYCFPTINVLNSFIAGSYLTRGRVTQWEGWNDVDNTDTERSFIMINPSIVTMPSYLSVLYQNGQSRQSLKLFHKVVNGLDPAIDVDGKLMRSLIVDSYDFARDELFV